jgi:hypothetical protein
MPLLINLLIFCIVLAIVYWIWTLLPLPQPAKNIILCVLLIILLVVFITYVYGGGGWGGHLVR